MRQTRRWSLGVALILAMTNACATGPRFAFNGNWVAQLPGGTSILFVATQTGDSAKGTVSNFGPLTTNSGQFSGTATSSSVTIGFSYPPTVGAQPVSWTFRGRFTNASTITGTITSATGTSGSMTITKDTGPLPV